MTKILKLLFLLISIYFVSSCKYDKVEPETEVIVNTDLCDSIPSSFASDVFPLLQNNCTPCHIDGGNSGGYSWSNFADVEPDKDKILSAIKHEEGTQNMPQGSGKLSDEDISKIECWILNGALDN